MKTLEQRIVHTLSRTAMIPEELLRPDAELGKLGIGSLEQIECVMAIEDELQIELPIADLHTLRTVADVVAAVRQAAGDAPTI